MKCPNCFNDIITSSQCKYCSNIFCSLTCLQFHYSNYHNSNNNNNNLKNQTIINSPFLIKGILNKSIIYDNIYSLNNFVPVLEDDGNLKTIGSGSYGQVYLGLNTITKKYYAIKHMDKKTIYELLHTLEAAKDEIEIQSKIDHPNIVKLLYVKETDISYDLIMEYAPKGNLFHFIRKTRGLTEDISFCLFIQIVNAINFLHENDLIHRDIKPENILIFDNDIVKLCDFGWCVKLDGQQRGTFCGTTEYMSPEIVNKIKYSKEIDIWSLGILLYEMVHGYSPFKPNKINFNAKEVIDKIKIHEIKFNINISKECKELIIHLLDENVENRYKIEDIFNSNFIKKYEKINFYFLNEKFPINNIKNERNILNNNSDKKFFENPLLLSSLIENDNIINKTLFNNFKYKSSNEYNMENKINNVVFNNIINRNPNNVKVKNSEKHRQLITQRELNRNRNLINNNSLNSSKEALNFNSSRTKKNVKVKVTKLSSTSLILNDGIKPNISYVKKINNDSDNLTDDFSFLNISSIIP